MNIRNSVLLFGLPLLTMLLSCRSISGRSDLNGLETDNNLDYFDRRLGSGFDSQDYRKLAPCLETANFVYAGANTSEFTFYRDYNYEDILDVASGGLYGKASFLGLVSAKVQGDMATSLATTDDSASFIYQFNIRGKSALLDALQFNPRGSSAFNTGDKMAFRDQCGNQYVERLSLGSQLFVGVKYTFTSKETKQEFKLKLSAELFWGLIKISKTWTKEQKAMLKDVVVSVEAFQIGGDTRKLDELLAIINNSSCFGTDATRCSDAVDRLLKYGSDELPKQLNNMELSNQPYNGLAILDVGTKAYNAERIYDPTQKAYVSAPAMDATKQSDELVALLSKLESLKADLKMALSRAKALAGFNLSKDEKNLLQLARQEIDGALSSADNSSNGNCKKAMTNLDFLARCSAETAALEKQVAHATTSLQLPPRS